MNSTWDSYENIRVTPLNSCHAVFANKLGNHKKEKKNKLLQIFSSRIVWKPERDHPSSTQQLLHEFFLSGLLEIPQSSHEISHFKINFDGVFIVIFHYNLEPTCPKINLIFFLNSRADMLKQILIFI